MRRSVAYTKRDRQADFHYDKEDLDPETHKQNHMLVAIVDT